MQAYSKLIPRPWKRYCFVVMLEAILLCSFLSPGFTATLHVPQEYKTVQKAIDKAHPGDTVLVQAGIYSEALLLKPGLIIKSQYCNRSFL